MPHSFTREGHKNFSTGCIKKTEQGLVQTVRVLLQNATGVREGVGLTLVDFGQGGQISALPVHLVPHSEAQPVRAYLSLSTIHPIIMHKTIIEMGLRIKIIITNH